jgi:hypothetical protein
MIRSSARRSLRRLTSVLAGTALVAAGLALTTAPAHAADTVVSGNVTDALGNPVAGFVSVYRQQPDNSYVFEDSVGANFGHFDLTLPDGTYKFEYGTYTNVREWYLDKTDMTTADPVVVAGGSPVALAAWTVEQPIITGAVVGPTGNPVRNAGVYAYDAATKAFESYAQTDDKGNFALRVGTDPVKVQFQGGAFATEWYSDKPSFATADSVTGTPTGAYIGVTTLVAGGVITGRVTNDAGVPLEMIRVQAEVGAVEVSDHTDKNGVYVIDNLDPGTYAVYFDDQLGEYIGEHHDNTTDIAKSTPVDVGVNQVVTVNAALTPRPAEPATSVEATGTVKDDLGAPVVGAIVQAVTTPGATGERQVVETTRSNRSGVYVLDELDKVAGENQFKLFGYADVQGDDNAFGLFGRWHGGQQSYDRAAVLTTTPPTPVGADIVLARAGGIAGSVTGVAGLPFGGYATAISSDGTFQDGTGTETDHTFEMRSLPAGTYKVGFGDGNGFHAFEWWKDSSFAKATTITVKPGQLTGGLDAVLSAALNAIERPEIGGYPWVGKPISVDRGQWNVETGTTFTYEWLVGSTVVGTGPTFTPSTSHIGDRLVVRVSTENGQLVGSATTLSTAKVGYQPKINVKVQGDEATIKVKASPVKVKKIKGTMVVKEIIKVKDDGTIKYKKIARTKINKGKGTVSLAKLKKGKHKLVFFFTGTGKVGSNDESVKVKIKR